MRNDLIENPFSKGRYLELLARDFPTIADASTEIINLEAILNLPKGTEHFLADLHGEYEAFQHVLKNASGTVRRKVNEIFGNTLHENELRELCTLIYYPKEKLRLVKMKEADLNEWYRVTLNQLVRVCQNASSKYTRSKVRKALPLKFSYIIQELLHESAIDPDKHDYIKGIIYTIVSTGMADSFIEAMCNLIQRLVIDSLHIVGDIYDRGPGAHIIMDTLCDYHHFDIQWGNHDVLWMGAASGNDACMANVLRLALRYGNMSTLEDGYGINLLPLATFAMDTYSDDSCILFGPRSAYDDGSMDTKTLSLLARMHKAISIIQFKLEAQIIDRHPELRMQNRKLLHRIDLQRGVLLMDNGEEYHMTDTFFPTLDPDDPYRLSPEEADVMGKIHASFLNSEKLRKHMRCLFMHGSMYNVCNNNLLFHGSIPMEPDGSFKQVVVNGKVYQGEALLIALEDVIRTAYFGSEDKAYHRYCQDYIWYLWCGPDSPLFDKDKMATFERYFVGDKTLHKETKGAYYTLRDTPAVCDRILEAFHITPNPHAHIINGHVPVKAVKGEKPVKAGGKLIVIDGGFSKAYQPETGIAGYTLVYHSHGLQLVQHEPFMSRQKAIEEGLDIKSTTFIVEFNTQRMRVKDTDKGLELRVQINDLKDLLEAYRSGKIKEKS